MRYYGKGTVFAGCLCLTDSALTDKGALFERDLLIGGLLRIYGEPLFARPYLPDSWPPPALLLLKVNLALKTTWSTNFQQLSDAPS